MDWALVIGPAVTAAAFGGGITLAVAYINRKALLDTHYEKLAADREKAIGEKAWADYENRRDAYTLVAERVACLFEGGRSDERPDLHKAARRVRLVGSDEVVRAMNALFQSIRDGEPAEVLEQRYRAMFNAMRRDIRQLHSLPPEGTDLGEDAFPIES